MRSAIWYRIHLSFYAVKWEAGALMDSKYEFNPSEPVKQLLIFFDFVPSLKTGDEHRENHTRCDRYQCIAAYDTQLASSPTSQLLIKLSHGWCVIYYTGPTFVQGPDFVSNVKVVRLSSLPSPSRFEAIIAIRCRPITDDSYVPSIRRISRRSTKHQTISLCHNRPFMLSEDPDRLL
jgi:hypothetical protein